MRFPSFICGSLYQCVLFLYILFLVLPIFEVPVPNSVVPNFSRSYVWCFLLLRSYLCVFLSLCYPKNGEAPAVAHNSERVQEVEMDGSQDSWPLAYSSESAQEREIWAHKALGLLLTPHKSWFRVMSQKKRQICAVSRLHILCHSAKITSF